MARQQVATTAASLLSTWTDADTAMQIVGTSLGLFGTGRLDPGTVLARETPLRNALFDVLLSLVEGGAIELRPTEDTGYAFRWRADYTAAGVTPGASGTIDLTAPSPYLAELARAQRERDDALGRAEFAEALATERERLLRLAEAPAPNPRPAKRASMRRRPEPVDIDLTEPASPTPVREPVPAPKAFAEPEPAAAAAPAPAPTPAPVESIVPAAIAEPAETIAAVEPVVTDAEPAVVATEAQPQKPPAKRAVPKKAVRKKPARKKAAPKETAAVESEPDAAPEVEEPADPESSDVIYLTPPAPEEAGTPQPKWSGYTIDKPRSHLSSVDSLADQV